MKKASAPVDVRTFARGGPISWLIVGGLILIAAITIGTTIMAGNFRERALQTSERELANTVLLLSRHFDQQLEDFMGIENDVVAQIAEARITSPDRFRGELSTLQWHEILRLKLGAYTDVAGVNVFDSKGELINSSENWPVPDLNISDRTFFRQFKAGFDDQFLVELVQARLAQGWATIIARKVTGPNDQFLGVVTRGITPASFEAYLGSLALAPGASISMHHRDGTLLARYPHVEGTIGRNFDTGPTDQRKVFELDSYSSRLISPVDGESRLFSSRALAKFPIVIVATTTTEAALADWREQTRFLIGVGAISVALIAIMLFLVVRKMSQEHRLSQQRLTLEKLRLDRAVNNMTQGLLLFDASQRLIVCNQRYIEMYGLSPDVVKPGCTFRQVIEHRKATGSLVGDENEYIASVLRDVSQKKGHIVETADGRAVQVINEPLEDGGWVATHEDITDRRRSEQRIMHLAHYDALTDLPNRALFHERLKRELASIPPGRRLAVYYIDIDEFKSVNDSLGHLVGDELLKSVAVSLTHCIGAGGFVARLGGDEFAVVQTEIASTDDVIDLVTRILATIRLPFECLGHQLATDASIGIALAPEHGVDLERILKNADLAMYAAKSAGRRTYRFFEAAMDARAKLRRQLEIELRQVIARGGLELEVHYQPCISLEDNRITGCEALMRWRHPERGMISPAEFIPIAEDTGLINELGEWVLNTACADAAAWPPDIRLAVNVSPAQFKCGTLALKIAAALAASGLPASRLEVEITEAVLIRDDEAALAILHQLRALGVRIALDDFGTGFSSLSYLQRFPFDKIKIDSCFVKDVAMPGGSSSIVRAVVYIAAARSMTTTAEGVETEAQRQQLRALGCSEMQGHLFSAARPASQIAALFTSYGEQGTAVALSQSRQQIPMTA